MDAPSLSTRKRRRGKDTEGAVSRFLRDVRAGRVPSDEVVEGLFADETDVGTIRDELLPSLTRLRSDTCAFFSSVVSLLRVAVRLATRHDDLAWMAVVLMDVFACEMPPSVCADYWNLMRAWTEALPAKPLLETMQLTVFHLSRGVGTAAAGAILGLVARTRMHLNVHFRYMEGLRLLMTTANHPEVHGALMEVMDEALGAAPDFVVLSPSFYPMLFALMSSDAPFPPDFLPDTLAAMGTLFVISGVAFARSSAAYRPFFHLLHAALTPEGRAALFSLWPERVAAEWEGLEGEWVVQSVPTTTYECPITREPCVDPVIASDGHTYERDAILQHLMRDRTSPLTRAPLHPAVVPNVALQERYPAATA